MTGELQGRCALCRRIRSLTIGLGVTVITGMAAQALSIGDDAEELAWRRVPSPAVERFEVEVRRQLEQERDRFELAIAGASSAAGIGESYGRLGRVYYAYDLVEPARICFLNARDAAPQDHRWHYYLAAVYQDRGDLEHAVLELEATLSLASEDPAALIRLGDVLFELGLLDRAEHAYLRALAADETTAAAVYGLGRITAARGGHVEAVALFERALESQPAATSIHHQLGIAHRALGDLQAARRSFELNTGGKVRFEDPLLVEVRRLVVSKQVSFEAGVEAARQGRLTEAIAHFRRAADANPKDAVVFHNLALAELRNGQRRAALADLERSAALDPDVRDVHLKLGSLKAEDGRLSEAEAHFRRAHEIDPEDLDSQLEWATALSRLGRVDRARAEVLEVLDRDAGHPRGRLALGILEARLGRATEASAELERVVEGSRATALEKAEAHNHLAVVKERSGNLEAAEHGYRKAVDLDPESAVRLESLARFLGRQTRFAEAADAYDRAVAVEGLRASAHFGRAMALLLDESYVDARLALEQSTARLPGDLALAHLLARLLATCPEGGVRDARLGHELAIEVHRVAPSPDHAQTVAMALAGLGRFEEAVAWQARAVEEIGATGSEPALRQARARLALFRRGERSLAPWLDSGS